MSTVKISELSLITQLNANTSNTLFLAVDIPTGVTGKFTGHTLAQGLYSNEVLNVGNNAIVYQNVIGQFSGNSGTYLQINNQNFDANGSSDYVASTNDSDNTNNYIDMGINGSNFSDVTYSSMKPYDGYVYSHGPAHTEYRGNLVIGTASTSANIVLIAGGTTSSNVVGRIGANIFDFLKNVRVTGTIAPSGGIVFSDGTTLTTSTPTAATYANGAFIQANAAFLVANTPTHVANSAALYANGAFVQANAAFTKANNALANTSGTFGGAMYITGNLSVNGTFLLANSNFSATESAVTISATTTTATPSNDGYMIHISGKNGAPTRLVSDAYGTGAYSLFAGRAARGTVESPTALQSGDVIARFSSNGYGTTKYQTLGVGRIDFVAAQNFTDANTGSQIQFWNCSVGSNTLTNIATFNGDSVTVTGHLEPQRGFVYTPTVFAGAQTAITINMTTQSLVRAQTAAGLVVTLSNLLAGKEVVAWITNTAGTNQTFTHGVSATNSTVNATTYTIPGTSTILARYISIDGTTQNTFVAITHA